MALDSKNDYRAAHEKLVALTAKNNLSDEENDSINILKVQIEAYETSHFEIQAPDPISAIHFRMDQLGLTRRDMEAYLGSRRKVSEVLSGKRALTLSMIRALHSGLKIPAGVLLREYDLSSENKTLEDWDWSKIPVVEIYKRGWISSKDLGNATTIKQLRDFLKPSKELYFSASYFRKTQYVRSARKVDNYQLLAWMCGIKHKALKAGTPKSKYEGTLDIDKMREIARLSRFDDGPIRAVKFLREMGVILVVERHFPKTYLDGAAILDKPDYPIVGLTLRYDRLNNFWFTLFHELAHISLHLQSGTKGFYDDLDHNSNDTPLEREADLLAEESLIPASEWFISPARVLQTPETARHLAEKLEIHPAIVAGHMQYVTKSYHILKNLVGHGEVVKQFNTSK